MLNSFLILQQGPPCVLPVIGLPAAHVRSREATMPTPASAHATPRKGRITALADAWKAQHTFFAALLGSTQCRSHRLGGFVTGANV